MQPMVQPIAAIARPKGFKQALARHERGRIHRKILDELTAFFERGKELKSVCAVDRKRTKAPNAEGRLTYGHGCHEKPPDSFSWIPIVSLQQMPVNGRRAQRERARHAAVSVV